MSINLDIIEAIDAEGGYAAIRISGLTGLPQDPTFRIDPVDEALVVDGETDWPAGPRRPVTIKSGNGMFDVVLGPDVLESPLLVAGTPVVVSITDTPATAELVWPSIATRRPRARRPVILTEELIEAERVATETRQRDAATALAAATAAASARAASAPAADVAAAERARAAARKKSYTNGAKPNGLAEATPPTAGDGRVLSGLNLSQQSDVSAATLIRKDGIAATPQPGTALAPIPQVIEPAPSRFRRQALAFAGGLGLAAALMLSLVQFRVINIQPVGQVAGGIPDVALTLAKNSGTLRTVLATGGLSPRGRNAGSVDGSGALRLADVYLYGSSDTPRDQGEASFWLRHALTQPIDHESMKWAYTQLGSIFAQPDGFAPDYAKARLLWEIAGALGDPVALCFNASLYEHGLGVPKHRDLARALYERARNAGGCRGVEEALKRTN